MLKFVSFSSAPGFPPPEDAIQQEAPHQQPTEGRSGLSTGAALNKVKKKGKRRYEES
jgi:hypothetical protein